ncbi:MAG: RluA family pseudouridine synthase [Leptospiraceae bacterium]|nr:RluA family pseudouridine synthase [Leptospiraceae bacterium]MCP5493476.1 RluA family pseudouridine synthase [Leptospiraceae bacterium]
MKIKAIVSEEFENYRLDQFLSQTTGDDISRTLVQKWIRDGHVWEISTQKQFKSNYKVSVGEEFEIDIPPKPKISLSPVKMDIPVIREYEDFLIIQKPAGIASHAGPGDPSFTLVNGLLYYFQSLSRAGGETRPGIVHRLDKPTSGLMIIAKNDRTHIAISEMFQRGEIEKRYYAWLVQGPNTGEGRIESCVGRHPTERLKMCVRKDGRNAITNYKITKIINSRRGRKFSLADVHIETGRTHQIRVHFQSLGCPVIGDMLYSKSGEEFKKYGLLLFAYRLQFKHPFSEEEIIHELPLPENFLQFEKEAIFR